MTEWPVERLKELVPNYLRGELKGEELQAFEEGLRQNGELQKELEEVRRLSIGVEVVDRLAMNHPTADDLVSYVYQPEQLSRESITRVEDHLKQCAECREEYELSKQAMLSAAAASVAVRAESDSIFDKLIAFLFPPQFVLRPAYVYIAVILLALPTYLGVRSLYKPGTTTITFPIRESGVRGSQDDNVFELPSNSKTICLQFPSFSARVGHRYNVIITDHQGRQVISWYGKQLDASASLEVPATLFADDTYNITFEEIDSSGNTTETFPPRVIRIQHSK